MPFLSIFYGDMLKRRRFWARFDYENQALDIREGGVINKLEKFGVPPPKAPVANIVVEPEVLVDEAEHLRFGLKARQVDGQTDEVVPPGSAVNELDSTPPEAEVDTAVEESSSLARMEDSYDDGEQPVSDIPIKVEKGPTIDEAHPFYLSGQAICVVDPFIRTKVPLQPFSTKNSSLISVSSLRTVPVRLVPA
jgi:hypothetical protein